MHQLLTRVLPPLAACLVFLLSGASATSASAEWELVRDRDNVKVWTRPVPGSDIQAVRAETLVPVELNQAMALLDDTAACPRWMHQCADPALVRKISPLERYTYMAIDLPWPASDRDVLVHVNIGQQESNREVSVHLLGVEPKPEIADRMPKRKGREPLRSMNGKFTLLPTGATSTRVSYELHLELGGSLPASVVNKQLIDNPFNTLKNMRSIAAEPRYQDFRPF